MILSHQTTLLTIQADQQIPTPTQYQFMVQYYDYSHFYDRLSLMDIYPMFQSAHFTFEEPLAIAEKKQNCLSSKQTIQTVIDLWHPTFRVIIERLTFIFPNLKKLGITFRRPLNEFKDIYFDEMPQYFNCFSCLQFLQILIEDQKNPQYDLSWSKYMLPTVNIINYRKSASVIHRSNTSINMADLERLEQLSFKKVESKSRFLTDQQRRKYVSLLTLDEHIIDTLDKVQEWRTVTLKLETFIPNPINFISEINFSILRQLNLQNNGIETIEAITRLRMYDLQILNLENNNITSGNPLAKLLPREIKTLSLTNNRVKQMTFQHLNQPLARYSGLFESFRNQHYCQNKRQIVRLQSRNKIRIRPQVRFEDIRPICEYWKKKIVYIN